MSWIGYGAIKPKDVEPDPDDGAFTGESNALHGAMMIAAYCTISSPATAKNLPQVTALVAQRLEERNA
jgi:hypothetical protein